MTQWRCRGLLPLQRIKIANKSNNKNKVANTVRDALSKVNLTRSQRRSIMNNINTNGNQQNQPRGGGRPNGGSNRKTGKLFRDRPNVNQTRGSPLVIANSARVIDTQSVRVQGSDWIDCIDIPETTALGTVIIDLPIGPHMYNRMSKFASAHQRAKWHSIRFELTPGFSALTGGQYIAAFVRDPDDINNLEARAKIKWLAGQQGAIQSNWMNETTMTITNLAKDWLYTSDGEEDRLVSPGRLVIACIAPPLQHGAFSAWMHWDITFRDPSIEVSDISGIVPMKEFRLPIDCGLTPFPSNGAYMALSKWGVEASYNFDPKVDINPMALLTLADIGVTGNYPYGTLFKMEYPATVAQDFHTFTGVPMPLTVQLLEWNSFTALGLGEDHQHQLTKHDCLAAVIVTKSPAGVVSRTYLDPSDTSQKQPHALYSGGLHWLAGTKISEYRPDAVLETRRIMYKGDWVDKPTGRMVLPVQPLPKAYVDQHVPKVRYSVYSANGNPITQDVNIVSTGGQALPGDNSIPIDWGFKSVSTNIASIGFDPVAPGSGGVLPINLKEVAGTNCPSQAGEVPTFIMGQHGDLAVDTGTTSVYQGLKYERQIPYLLDTGKPVGVSSANGFVNVNIGRVAGLTTPASGGRMPSDSNVSIADIHDGSWCALAGNRLNGINRAILPTITMGLTDRSGGELPNGVLLPLDPGLFSGQDISSGYGAMPSSALKVTGASGPIDETEEPNLALETLSLE